MSFTLWRLKKPVPAELARPQPGLTQSAQQEWWSARKECLDQDGEWNVRNGFFGLAAQALQAAGATWEAPAAHPPLPPRSPDGKIAIQKFSSNDGWLVTADEAGYLADALEHYLDGEPTLQLVQVDMDAFLRAPRGAPPPLVTVPFRLSPSSDREDERSVTASLREMVSFMRRAAALCGFEVW